ncbi:hypothetical protein FA95DRAFT_222692 [Auriscalpium vulgare]|uniref:Uncharacterized protein n=1 Tax=Auriscalpium vulgare TaxID=40419 RepID=A0ACB8RM46_9AGAM|nr:hypothetical protein FA95DRAFT_222692 [Auriscalpium vulgare]
MPSRSHRLLFSPSKTSIIILRFFTAVVCVISTTVFFVRIDTAARDPALTCRGHPMFVHAGRAAGPVRIPALLCFVPTGGYHGLTADRASTRPWCDDRG